MLSFLFWNLAGNAAIAPYVARLATTYAVDVFLFAECPLDTTLIMEMLNDVRRGVYWEPKTEKTKVRVISRLPLTDLVPQFTNIGGDMTIWKLKASDAPFLLLAAAHLPAKIGGFSEFDQLSRAQAVAGEIAEVEDDLGSRHTVLVGDLNMNPFDPGVVNVTGIHGLMAKSLARQKDRRYKGSLYRRFYNPMWGLFGDRTPGPAGTYFWETSVPSNQHWSILDQVLVRPALMDRFRNVQILAGDGYQSFLTEKGTPDKANISDHLPVLFQIEI
jgi:endonuclease/exonuclease/phosphatase family metal-dependent hydrolase